ncbi:MAG: hypothetical protein LC792_01275 [Actinobacteria bacterium]|nr:hypothetical protein [Actinomycetota bacterium]
MFDNDVGAVAAAAGVATLVLTHFIPSSDAFPDDHWVEGARRGFGGEVIAGSDLFELTL